MDARPTPGPWSDGDVWPDPETGDWHGAISSPDQFIANVLQSGIRSADEARANLRLFAAARDMLDALREAKGLADMAVMSDDQDGAPSEDQTALVALRAKIDAAISKATSRQPEGER